MPFLLKLVSTEPFPEDAIGARVRRPPKSRANSLKNDFNYSYILPNAKHKNKFQMEIITTLDYLPRGTYS
jgi:hypothetical protein